MTIIVTGFCCCTGKYKALDIDAQTLQARSVLLKSRASRASYFREGVVALWCNPLTLQPEQSGGVSSIPGRAPPFERHDKGSLTRSA